MNKRLIFLVVSCCILNGQRSRSYDAFMLLKPAINNYQANALKSDRVNLYRYMSYYHNWYQLILQQPPQYFEVLSNKARELIAQIKEAAEQFTIVTGGIAQSQTLSTDGVQFYNYILNELKLR